MNKSMMTDHFRTPREAGLTRTTGIGRFCTIELYRVEPEARFPDPIKALSGC